MKHLKRILLARTAIVLLVMMLSTATTAWAWEGSGTSSDPYQIASYEHLLELHDNVNNGQKYENVYFVQTQDITWPSNTTWDHAIGYDYSHCFSGHYNGNGKKISGFRLATSDAYAGLFGFFNGSNQGSEQSSVIAEVHHLTLENPTVTVTASSSTQYAGALVGNTEQCGRADNNTVIGGTVSYTGVSSNTVCYAGGLVGYWKGSFARLSGNTVVGTTISGAYVCGGLAGYVEFTTIPRDNFADATLNSAESVSDGLSYKREGALVGYCNHLNSTGSSTSGNYYHSATNLNAFGQYYVYSGSPTIVTPNDPTGYTRVYTVTCSGGVTATATTAHTYNGTSYYAGTVTLSGLVQKEGFTSMTYTVNGRAISGNTFNISGNTTVGYSGTPDSNHLSVSGTTYTIKTLTGWNVFCDLIEGGKSFSGNTVRLNTDIGTTQAPVTRMAGSEGHEFSGTFNGNEKTLTVAISTSASNAAPFREIKGATISHLKVSGSVSGKRHTAGLVGFARGESASVANTIEDCLVETAVSIIGDDRGYLGGIVGHGLHSKLTIRGCAFTGSLTSTSYYTGGLQGWSDGNTLILQNDLFEPSSVSAAPNGFHPVAIHANNATTAATVSNVYYTVAPTCTASTRIAANGKRARSITAGAFVSISAIDFFGIERTYSVSGIYAYDDGGLKRGNNSYCGSGDNVKLTLSNSVPEGCTFSNYVVSPDGVSLSDPTVDRPTLTMPDADVTVSAAFYVNMPKTGTKTVNIPSGVQSFKVYDDGGPNSYYSYDCDGYLTLTAPEGYVLLLEGSINTEIDKDFLSVYDGSGNSGTLLLDRVSSSSYNINTSITPVNSTGQSMMLWFHSNGSYNYAGLDLTVTLVSTSTEFAINGLGAATGGSMAASLTGQSITTAKWKDVVTLTATPESDYMLSGISVVDENNHAVNVSWDGLPSNTATFTMPLSDVTVTPTFSYDMFDIAVNSATGGSIAASLDGQSITTAKWKDVVTLTATPKSGYLLSGISVVDENNHAVNVSWDGLPSNTATFTMPLSKVTVTPTFTSNWTADGGLYVNMPQTGTKTVNIPSGVKSFKVYDDGGANGNYSDNYNGYLTLTAPEGYVLQLSGSITTESNNDYLYAYNGNGNNAPTLLHQVSGTTNITTVHSTGQSMMLWFHSNGSSNYAGLDLTVTVIRSENTITVNNPATGGSIAASLAGQSITTANCNDMVTLTATPASGYVLSGISVVDAKSNAVNVSWDGMFYNNTATFTMPLSAVTVTPTFTNNNLTADGGLYVNMPQTGTKTVTIPSGVKSFKVYDDGGANGNYSSNCNGTLTLTAPEGYVLQLSGNITTESNNDYLTAYNGNGNNAPTLLHQVSGTTSITTVHSTGQSMTLWFHSNGSSNYAGLDLTVTVIRSENTITVNNPATGGSIAASLAGQSITTANWNDIVTLTATPASGYVLSGISVVDAKNNAVNVSWDGMFYNNTATFTMPLSEVTVTPTFTNNNLTADGGLYVNMPQTGTKTVTIPSGVKSFKVYDDGGVNGNYSYYCDGYLTLTAPEGYALKLEGNMTTPKNNDYLTVYDGDGNTASTLLNQVSSYSNGAQTTITTVYSSGRSMTLWFHSDGGLIFAGLDLTVTVVKIMELADGGDNSSTINAADGMYDVTLRDRTLYKDGAWNTLCLPFNLTLAGSPLAGAEARTLQGATLTGGTLNLQFGDAITELVAGTPYIIKWEKLVIRSADDWNSFASAVNNGKSYEGKVVQLGSDIEGVTQMVGTEAHPFTGTFDGAGHTLKVSIVGGNQGTAPFNYISGATIMNVKVTGTVNGGIHCAGLVGFAWNGTNRIMNCEVAATVNCSGSHCGGILGHGKASATTISNCLFSGSISGATDAQGIIYGWGDAPGQHTIENCLAAGTYSGTENVDLLKIYGGTQTITNCYRRTALGEQGTDASNWSATVLANALNNGGADWQVDDDGNVVPVFDKTPNLTAPTFYGVTIDKTMNDKTFTGVVTFKGNYYFRSFTDDDRSILFMGAENTLYWPQSGASIGACRAYFQLAYGITAGDVSNARLFFGSDDTQGIISVESGQSDIDSETGSWYTLNGMKVEKPKRKGLYIHNGRKVVVK